jgi:hypothetical protein
MEDERITLETAKLAKEKGFHVALNASYTEYLVNKKDREYPEGGGPFSMRKGEVEFNTFWFCNDHPQMDYSNKNYIMYAAPTQALLQRWLREKHSIHVEIYCNASGWGYILTKLNGTTIKEIEDDVFFETAEIACEKGLQFALNMIKI